MSIRLDNVAQAITDIARSIKRLSERVRTLETNEYSSTGGGGGIDHGGLLGLGDDDHLQYAMLNGVRAFENNGLLIEDIDASHNLRISTGSDLTADRELSINTGDADRTIILSGNPTLNDWFDQSVKQASGPSFTGITDLSTSVTNVAAGTTGQRPAGTVGDIRYNGTLGAFEIYIGSWVNVLDSGDLGVSVQAYNAGLADIAGLAVTDGNFIVGDDANFIAESGNTARTSLGLGTGDSPTFAGLTLEGNQVIDVTSTEALLVRKDADGGDVFNVDTTDSIIKANGTFYINDTVNTFMAQGLTINQGGNDNEIFSLKSSDVAHGMTNVAETDTYGSIQKGEGAAGGLMIRGYKDADGTPNKALGFQAWLGEAADTTKNTNSHGIVSIYAAIKDGVGQQAPGADSNLFSVSTFGATRFIFDVEGSAHADVEWTTYDKFDDLAILRDLEATLVPDVFGKVIKHGREFFEQHGLLHDVRKENEKTRGMLNQTKLLMLQTGAISQLAKKVFELEQKLLEA